jgi:hypothetical protein
MKYSKKKVRKSSKLKKYNRKTKKNIRRNKYLKKRGGNKEVIETALREGRIGTGPEKYLEKICPSSGYCLSFGRATNIIKEYFDNFVSFTYYDESQDISQNKLITKSNNGFINLINYKRGNYRACAILKSAIGETPDSLFYETYIGLYFINNLKKYYPCFLETYGMFKHKNYETKRIFEDDDAYDMIKIDLVNSLNYIPISKTLNMNEINNYACNNVINNAVLIEYINNPITLHQFMETNKSDKYSFTVDLVQILFQIYSVLSELQMNFTHYDLHTGNILLYEIPDGKFIEMIYVLRDDTEIKFKTKYIAKIIDYGRCYTYLTPKLYNLLCESNICYANKRKKCYDELFNYGFQMMDDENVDGWYYIKNRFPNISHDLRLVNILKHTPKKYSGEYATSIRIILNNIEYVEDYGTPEILDSGLPDKINNVEDMFISLKNLILNESYFRDLNDEKFNDNNLKSATIKVYLERYDYEDGIEKEMEFIPYNINE